MSASGSSWAASVTVTFLDARLCSGECLDDCLILDSAHSCLLSVCQFVCLVARSRLSSGDVSNGPLLHTKKTTLALFLGVPKYRPSASMQADRNLFPMGLQGEIGSPCCIQKNGICPVFGGQR